MNKRIAMSAMSIFGALAIMGGTTFAFWSDSGLSDNNVFAAGTMDLKLSDNDETAQDNVLASFGGSGLGPGDCTTTQTLEVQNSGTESANHIELAVVNTVTDVGVDATPDIDAFLHLDLFAYDGGNINLGSDPNSNGFQDLDDLETLGVDDLPLTNLATNHLFEVRVCLHSTALNGVQGDSVSSDWTVT